MSILWFDIPIDIWDNFGYANGWDETPAVIKNCNHAAEYRMVGRGVTEYRCEKCRYVYLVDSSG